MRGRERGREREGEREKQEREGVMLGERSRDDDMEKSRPLLLICYAFGTFACSCSMVLFSLFFFFLLFSSIRGEDFWDFHLLYRFFSFLTSSSN